jgi:hypothetical protein
MTVATSITVCVPLKIRRRPGRKTVVTPVRDSGESALSTRTDPALVTALARVFRPALTGRGALRFDSEMAAAERIERGYLGTLLRLTLLAPDIVEAILDGRQPDDVTLRRRMTSLPVEWHKQDWRSERTSYGSADTPSSCRTRLTQNATPCGSAASLKS